MMKKYHSIYNTVNKGCFDEEGYFRTGDVGFYDDEGFWHYVDRCKDLIHYNGHVISPYEIEGVLHHHPGVLESLVYGEQDPNDVHNQLIAACVTLVAGFETTESELKKFVSSQVPEHKCIRGNLQFVEKLPRNGMGKLVRRKDLWKSVIVAVKVMTWAKRPHGTNVTQVN